MYSENLFTNYSQVENNAPLADKLRPKNLEDFFGQQPILNENSLLRNAILTVSYTHLTLPTSYAV